MTYKMVAFGVLVSFLPLNQATAKEFGVCKFNSETLSFAGTAIEQAKCLLRKVPFQADSEKFGKKLDKLPEPLNILVGSEFDISKSAITNYLLSKKICEADVGISIPSNLPKSAINADYFVIHDTSTPNCSNPEDYDNKNTNECPEFGELPNSVMDSENWPFNKKGDKLVLRNDKKEAAAHVYISRTGESKIGHDFSEGWRATRLEGDKKVGISSRGRFIHIENVQPRKGNPARPKQNKDHNYDGSLAPEIGFTTAQYSRLALIYITASARRGQWLIPGFHASIDDGVSDGAHDDPQNFDLVKWTNTLKELIVEIKSTETKDPTSY